MLLFAVLIGFTSYWSVFDADELEANRANKRPLLEEQQIRRGLIVAADGTVLARNRGEGHLAAVLRARLSPGRAVRRIPWVTASWSAAASGLEREYNDDLTGKHDEFETILDELRGKEREGDDVVTTLDPQAQRTAIDGLAGRAGVGRRARARDGPGAGDGERAGVRPQLDPRATSPTCAARPGRRCSTARSRAATRPARRSRS